MQQFYQHFVVFLIIYFVQGKSYLEDLTISAKEKILLDQFRKRVINQLPFDYMKKDVFLIRWLRTSYFDLEKAERLIKKNLQWRIANKMETIQQEDWSDLIEDYRYSLKGRTIDGKPVLYLNVQAWDVRLAAVSGKTERFLRYIDKILDETVTLIRELGEKQGNVSQAILLLNLKGFSLQQHGCLQCIPLILNIISSYEAHFPGAADKIILINAPAIAEPVIRVSRAALHPLTNQVFFAYGTNKEVWWRVLTQDLREDQIPIDLGGSLIDDADYDYFEKIQ